MKVWVYPEKAWEEFGAERFEVEWETVKPSALARVRAAEERGECDEIDPDGDIRCHYRHYQTEAAAKRAARAVVNFGKTAYGSARVTKQAVGWYVEEDRIAEWEAVGEPIYID